MPILHWDKQELDFGVARRAACRSLLFASETIAARAAYCGAGADM